MILTLSMTAALAACGGGSSGGGSPTPSAQPTSGAGAQAAITNVYEHFFSAPVPVAKTMLEDGDQLSTAFVIAKQLKGKMVESAMVKTVTLTGPTTADVLYSLSADGSVLLPNSNGHAVYVDGKWLVSKDTFCGLIQLGYSKPIPNC
jgi:hypothetical protein